MPSLRTLLITIGSIITIAFGLWHFFVPTIWNWSAYIVPEATELVVAVRAINLLLSLCLVLLGTVNLVFVWFQPQNRFSLTVLLSASSLLWAARVGLQLVYPQGSISPWLQYGLLATFSLVFVSFAVALYLTLRRSSTASSAR